MRIDCHVHLVGTGTSNSGCWYRPKGLTKYGEPIMTKAIGLTVKDLHGPEFDQLYIRKLVKKHPRKQPHRQSPHPRPRASPHRRRHPTPRAILALRPERLRSQSRRRAPRVPSCRLHPPGEKRSPRRTQRMPRPRCRRPQVPAQRPRHRLEQPTLHQIPRTHGGSRSPASRPHRQ